MVLLAAMAFWQAAPSVEAVMQRVSEEAEIFAQVAPRVIGEETLVHKGRQSPPRFRPRVGTAPLGYRLREREIISEYGFAALKDAPEALREFRKVVAVDGKQVAAREKARLALAQNMASEDDRARKGMLQDFEKYGMIGAATDFGQSLLLFRRRSLGGYEFSMGEERLSGADKVLKVRFRQRDTGDAAKVYHGRELTRVKMSGEIWVRTEDFRPVRVTLLVPVEENRVPVEHRAEVDYNLSGHGCLLPVAVRYTRAQQGQVMVENRYAYAAFKMFQVSAEIKFTPADEPEPQK